MRYLSSSVYEELDGIDHVEVTTMGHVTRLQ